MKVDHSDDSSTMQASYVINARDQSIGFSMMQAILPQLSLGGRIGEFRNDNNTIVYC